MATRKGTNGVTTNGVTANVMSVDRGALGVPPLTYLYIPNSARAYLFPDLSRSGKIYLLCTNITAKVHLLCTNGAAKILTLQRPH